MTYTITIDQQFAEINNLSLVQVSTLAAFMTLPIWAKNIAIDGKVWYMYSDEKMAEDFPLLFGIPKRCYKNISELAEMGFVELTKLGRTKYIRFTERCRDWGKEKEQICSDSPKTDYMQTENGLNKSPKTDYITNNINNTKDINTNNPDGVLFQPEPIQEKKRGTSENLCLFANSKYNDFETFMACFNGPEYAGIDVGYYYNVVVDWSSSKGAKKRDWIATARNIMRNDEAKGKLRKFNGTNPGGLSNEAMEYLKFIND